MATRDQFEKWNYDQKVSFINIHLKLGKTLTTIAEMVGMTRSGMQSQLHKAGFIFDKKDKQYYFDEVLMSNPLTATEILTKLEKIEKLLHRYMIGEEKIPYEESNRYIGELPYGEEIRVTIRINKNIWERFGSFCKRDLTNYHKKDLLSYALLHFIENYKKVL